jgi:hypothetical protein
VVGTSRASRHRAQASMPGRSGLSRGADRLGTERFGARSERRWRHAVLVGDAWRLRPRARRRNDALALNRAREMGQVARGQRTLPGPHSPRPITT